MICYRDPWNTQLFLMTFLLDIMIGGYGIRVKDIWVHDPEILRTMNIESTQDPPRCQRVLLCCDERSGRHTYSVMG